LKQAAIYVLYGLGALFALWLLINFVLITYAATARHLAAVPKFVRGYPGRAAAICGAGIMLILIPTTLGVAFPVAFTIGLAVTSLFMIWFSARALRR
jgi:hypothetical protein